MIIWIQEAVLPLSSVAVQVRVMVVTQSTVEEESLCEISTLGSQSSDADAVPVAAGLVSDGLTPRSISAGQVITGAVVSDV